MFRMAQRLRIVLAVSLLLLLSVLLLGCKSRRKSNTVVVHLLRNLSSPYGSELDRRILDFQGSNPRLGSGEPITVESETGDYKQLLEKQTSTNDDIDLIVLDAAADASGNPVLTSALGSAVNVCAGLKACPTVIPSIVPSQITGENRDAALQFQSFLQKAP